MQKEFRLFRGHKGFYLVTHKFELDGLWVYFVWPYLLGSDNNSCVSATTIGSMYKIKHMAKQSQFSPNIKGNVGRTVELNDFKH